jgi:hypothetical protein
MKKIPSSRGESAYGVLRSMKSRRGRRTPNQIYPKEFAPFEIAAIGVMTVQWAYLEHMVLIRTAEICDAAGADLPSDATELSFERRLETLRDVAKGLVCDEWQRKKLLAVVNRISNIKPQRQRPIRRPCGFLIRPVQLDQLSPKPGNHIHAAN